MPPTNLAVRRATITTPTGATLEAHRLSIYRGSLRVFDGRGRSVLNVPALDWTATGRRSYSIETDAGAYLVTGEGCGCGGAA